MNEEINKALQILKKGGIILFPTDTEWVIGCDASNQTAVNKILTLNKSKNTNHFVCLVPDERMLKKYVKQIPSTALNILEITDQPTTIIYDEAQNLTLSLIANDGSIAIRIPDNDFCYWLTRKLNGTIATITTSTDKQKPLKSFKEITPAILKGVDYVVNLHHEKTFSKPPSIIKLSNNGIVKVIRE